MPTSPPLLASEAHAILSTLGFSVLRASVAYYVASQMTDEDLDFAKVVVPLTAADALISWIFQQNLAHMLGVKL
jgi:Na+/melibiose symporter-like transporter